MTVFMVSVWFLFYFYSFSKKNDSKSFPCLQLQLHPSYRYSARLPLKQISIFDVHHYWYGIVSYTFHLESTTPTIQFFDVNYFGTSLTPVSFLFTVQSCQIAFWRLLYVPFLRSNSTLS